MTIFVLVILFAAGSFVIYRLLTSLSLVAGLCFSILVAALMIAPLVGLVPVISEPTSPPDYRTNEYRTSQTCKSCHADHYHTWHDTYHRTMTQDVTEESVLGRFDGEQISVSGYAVRPFRRNGRWFMSLVDPDWEQQEFLAGRDPRATEDPPSMTYQVDRLVGSHHQQVYLTRSADGSYRTLPVVWLEEQDRWTTRGGTFLKLSGPSFYSQTKLWNNGCVFCHNTRGRPGLSAARTLDGAAMYAWKTEVEELGIACEACHGSGDHHVQLNQNPSRRYWQSIAGENDPSIVNPATLPQELSVLVCARCHGKMIARDEFDQACLVDGDFFQPGDWESRNHYSMPEPGPGAEFDESDEGRYFWADGTPRTTALEYQGLVMSPCYQQGEMTCLSCHGMHNTDPNDQLLYGDNASVPIRERNLACVQCHEEFSSADVLSAHTHHEPSSSGSLCYNCHMPFHAYSLLKRVRSHYISTPSVTLSFDTGIPNACNQCHVDQSLEWTDRIMADWFDSPAAALDEDARHIAAMPSDLLSGHALQRALAAEQLGWSETFELAGLAWRAPLLVEALEDEYAAVRLLAYEALAQLPGFEDFEFDYIGIEAVRAQQVAEARRRCQESSTGPVRERLREILGGSEDTTVEQLVEQMKLRRNEAMIDILE